MDDEHWMRRAIEICRAGIAAGQTPFGAVIVRGGADPVAAHNVVWQTTDITAHAEVHCIRLACQAFRTVDLSGCTIYSTTEPCPMCFSAIHWARIGRIVFGASIADAAAAGFSELEISNEQMRALGRSTVRIESGVLADQCRELFSLWKSHPAARVY